MEQHGEPKAALFSGASNFSANGGQYGAAGRDMHHSVAVNIDIHNNQRRKPEIQATNSSFGTGSNAEDATEPRSNVVTGRTASTQPISLRSRLRFLDIFRFRRASDTTVVDLSYDPIIQPVRGPISFSPMIPKTSETYLRLMLMHGHGYPLYEPNPDLRNWKTGIRIGDVGRVTPDGAFDLLFNVSPLEGDQTELSSLPANFTPVPLLKSSVRPHFQHGEHILSEDLKQTDVSPITYKCSTSEGAVLRLPEGASRYEAMNLSDFRDLAARNALDWYRYMVVDEARDVPNGSLYLITGCIKTTNWGIGVFCGQPSETNYLQFTADTHTSPATFRWIKSGPITTKIGMSTVNAIDSDTDEPNQCIFLRGYKITLGQKLWKRLEKSTVSVPSTKGTSPHSASGRTKSGPNNGDSASRDVSKKFSRNAGNAQLNDFGADDASSPDNLEQESVDVVLEHSNASSLIHPSEIINEMLLREKPDALVALTHDDEWSHLLPENFFKDPSNVQVNAFLDAVAKTYIPVIDQNGCVSLLRAPVAEPILSRLEPPLEAPVESSVPLDPIEVASPSRPKPKKLRKGKPRDTVEGPAEPSSSFAFLGRSASNTGPAARQTFPSFSSPDFSSDKSKRITPRTIAKTFRRLGRRLKFRRRDITSLSDAASEIISFQEAERMNYDPTILEGYDECINYRDSR